VKKFILSLFIAVMASSAVASDCITQSRITGFSNNNSNTEITVQAMGPVNYKVTVNYCFDLDRAIRIGFETMSSWVCRGDRLLVLDTFDNHILNRCFITNIEKIPKN